MDETAGLLDGVSGELELIEGPFDGIADVSGHVRSSRTDGVTGRVDRRGGEGQNRPSSPGSRDLVRVYSGFACQSVGWQSEACPRVFVNRRRDNAWARFALPTRHHPTEARLHLPITPPVLPMLAKRGRRAARGRGLDLRAEVGRLPRAGFPRRRRGVHPEPRREAARPLLSRADRAAQGRSCPERCVLDGEIVIVRTGRARLRGAAAAPPPGGLAREAPVERDPGLVRVLRSALRRRSRPARRRRSRERRASARDRARAGKAAAPPDAGDARPRASPPTGSALRGRGPRRRDGEAGGRHLRARQARHAEGEARARMRLRRRRVPLAQGRRGRRGRIAAPRPLRRRRQPCSMSASAPASPTPSAASWSSSSRRIA